MTFDNTDELYKIARAHPSAKLVVRILTDDSKSLCRLGLKFGAPLVTVPALLSKARELGLDVIGVSFHVGSGCFDSSAFADAIMRARAAFDMGREAGFEFDFLDVGGGFEDAHFEKTAAVLNTALDQYFPDRRKLKVIAEPGRFYVSRAFTLATNIIARRAKAPSDILHCARDDTSSASEGPSVMCTLLPLIPDMEPRKLAYADRSSAVFTDYINDGVYGSFNCIMFDHQSPLPYCLTIGKVLMAAQSGSVGSGPMLTSSVWGPTCDSIDCVCPAVKLPAALEVGDWLGFRNMGAYTVCAASQFNGFETSPVVYTVGDEGKVGVLLGAW
jgi:ornithine decarboxylase